MNFEQFKEKLLLGLASIFVATCMSLVGIMFSLNEKIHDMNSKLAVIVEKVALHDSQISIIIKEITNNQREK